MRFWDENKCSFCCYIYTYSGDCSALDIDGYLLGCSEEFTGAAYDIGELRQDVNTNTDNIATNTQTIGTHTTAIDTNTGNIGTNTNNIDANKESIDTNTDNIATNIDNIATNTNTMDAHAQAIADIQETLDKLANIHLAGEDQSATLFDLDINHQNYLLLLSLIMNVGSTCV